MKGLVSRFGKIITTSFIVMAVGIVLFILTPILYGNFGIDTDVIGLIIFTTGLAICIIGIIRRKKPHGWKLIALIILAIILLLPLVTLIASSIYFLTTGGPMGAELR